MSKKSIVNIIIKQETAHTIKLNEKKKNGSKGTRNLHQ